MVHPYKRTTSNPTKQYSNQKKLIMKTIILTLIMLVAVAMTAVAREDTRPQKDLIPIFKGEESGNSNRAAAQQDEIKYLDVTLEHAGELAFKLGDGPEILDSLVVRGPVNAADFRAMFMASLNRKLSAINLKYSVIEGGKIPEYAFWDPDEQLIPDSYNYWCIFLRNIIFPESLKEIGDYAFMFAKRLETINLPSSLEKIGTACFETCSNLNVSPMIFPNGMKEIGKSAFSGCNYLWDKEKDTWKEFEIVIPSTVKIIHKNAFYLCNISKLTLSEGVENIGQMAFYGNALKEITIPGSCKNLGEIAFGNNYDLEKVYLLEGLTEIPKKLVDGCFRLKEINIPSTVSTIGDAAFNDCKELTYLNLPEGLKEIGCNAFRNCYKLTEICFPASLEYLGGGSCSSLKKIYCKATTPPVCGEDPNKPPYGPFGVPLGSNAMITYPLYIPKGTLEKYVNTLGWENFGNVTEIEEFPAGLNDVVVDSETEDQTIYDLMGRKVLNPISGQLYIKGGQKFIHK